MAGNNPVTWKQLFDFSKATEIKGAVKTIKNLDGVYSGLIKNLKTKGKAYDSTLRKMAESARKYAEALDKQNASTVKGAQNIVNINSGAAKLSNTFGSLKGKVVAVDGSIKVLTREQKLFNEKAKETIRLDKQLITLEAKKSRANSNSAKEIAKLRIEIANKNKEVKVSAQESLKLVTLYQKETKRLIELRKAYKEVALAEGTASKKARELQKELLTLDARLKKVDASAGQFQRNVGGYKQALTGMTGGFRNLAAALGFTGAIFLLVSAFKGAVQVIRDFQDGSADLAGILGKSRKEIKGLTDEAQRLGAITAKTAKEVLDLEIAYARLGFTQTEILNMTEDTINGSIALSAELGETAELAGAVVRTFKDFSSLDTATILDIMTKATQKSALNFTKLQTAIPIVSGAAEAAGLSFTEMTAILGKLSDAGIDTSTSATALRNMLIISASQGENYTQVLERIKGSSDKLTAANDEFGRRVAVSSSILATQIDKIKDLKVVLEDAGGAAEAFAKEKLDTLTGSLDLLSSAWSGLILSIEDGEGKLNAFFRGFIDQLASLLSLVTAWNEGVINAGELAGALTNPIVKAVVEAKILGKTLEDTAKREEDAKRTLSVAQEMYNNAVKNGLDTNDKFIESLRDEIKNNTENTGVLTEVARLYGEVEKAKVALNDEKKPKGDKIPAGMESIAALEALLAQLKAKSSGASLEQIGEINDQIKRVEASIKNFQESSASAFDGVKGKLVGAITGGVNELGAVPNIMEQVIIKSVSKLAQFLGTTGMEISGWVDRNLSKIVEGATNVVGIMDGIAERQNQKDDERIERIQEQKQKELSIAGDNKIAQQAIEDKYDKQVEKIEDRQAKRKEKIAKFDKAIAITQAIIQTAAKVIEFGIITPQAIIAGALGAIQVAAMVAQPIPKYEDGTKSAIGGAALVGEVGPEIQITPDGSVSVIGQGGPELRDVPKGSEILTNAIFNRLMSGGDREKNDDVSGAIRQVLREEKGGNISATIKHTMKRETDVMLQGMQGIMKGIPISVFRGGPGRVIRDVVIGDTTYKDVEEENSFGE